MEIVMCKCGFATILKSMPTPKNNDHINWMDVYLFGNTST